MSRQALDRIDHVAIQVDDVADAVDWYRARITCEVEYQDQTWALLRMSNLRLALVVPGQHPPHVAMRTPLAETFGTLKPHRDGTASCYVKDPSGNVVEFMKP